MIWWAVNYLAGDITSKRKFQRKIRKKYGQQPIHKIEKELNHLSLFSTSIKAHLVKKKG